MLTIEQNAETVAKENLREYRFSAEDVLPSVAERQLRRYSAERATTLGNGYQSKVNIYFRTADGATKRVQTTVWATDADFLTLKSGKAIPLRSVLGFDSY
ncbi:hypothetical protein [Hymenobacter rubripertinctus]|uniref:Uncharacterized protein n=1 Tax=Hymenobacter rubripertinctus TaxID=2029981 RepID=A0A418R0T9_9BACT|nr:hypothetical protein [Hymenobacter rubripertinctus]RIY11042.1 hypothetical protein D0T11_08525 [Hymenobacter rubripertinctus]